jgi:hypothetical protein
VISLKKKRTHPESHSATNAPGQEVHQHAEPRR